LFCVVLFDFLQTKAYGGFVVCCFVVVVLGGGGGGCLYFVFVYPLC